MATVAISDAGKTKIEVRFDENDGIVKYYKEFCSILCTIQGPRSVNYKVKLLDNSRKEICNGLVDGPILQIANYTENGFNTDDKGKGSFSCIITKGCQA